MNIPSQDRKWYQKKRYTLPLAAIIGAIGISSFNSTPSAPVPVVESARTVAPQTQQVVSPVSATQVKTKSVNTDAQLSNDNYYKNVDGNTVHSPAYSDAIPAGATAQCGDGTYSFSQHRSGTCSHHGGVARWL